MQKSVLWAEDLEGHRQPSLYYLNEDDDGRVDGPHLICDWNGPPTDYEELDIDTLGLLRQQEPLHGHKTTAREAADEALRNSGDKFVDYPNPAADLLKNKSPDGPISIPTQRQNDFDLVECAHLDFLSVPPITQGLLRHIVKSIKNVKVQQERQKELMSKEKSNVKN